MIAPAGRRILSAASVLAAGAGLLLPPAASAAPSARDAGAEPPAAPQPSPVTRPDEAASVYREVPEVPIRLCDGREAKLSDLWRERPLLMTLVFSRCAGVCSPFLGTLRSLAEDEGGGGKDYNLLALSFDSRDEPADLAAMAEAAGASGKPGWHFAVAPREAIDRLTAFLDYRTQWNESTGQFDHPATMIAIDEGRVVRVVTGGALSPARFREVTAELAGGFVSIYPMEADVRFRCFEFGRDGNPRPSWGMLLLVCPVLGALALVAAIFLPRAAGAEPPDRAEDRRPPLAPPVEAK